MGGCRQNIGRLFRTLQVSPSSSCVSCVSHHQLQSDHLTQPLCSGLNNRSDTYTDSHRYGLRGCRKYSWPPLTVLHPQSVRLHNPLTTSASLRSFVPIASLPLPRQSLFALTSLLPASVPEVDVAPTDTRHQPSNLNTTTVATMTTMSANIGSRGSVKRAMHVTTFTNTTSER